MAKGSIKNISIKGIACAVPDQIRDSEFWNDEFGEEAVDKFVKMTGVKRVCQSIKEQTASDLAYVAAETLLRKKDIDPVGIIQTVDIKIDRLKPGSSFGDEGDDLLDAGVSGTLR